jgi:serine/threonine protein kinase
MIPLTLCLDFFSCFIPFPFFSPDTSLPGVSMISAIAPVYYTGDFRGYQYQDTWMGVVGLDITIVAISEFLNDLQDKLTSDSFGLLVDSKFNTIVISHEVVRRIYPAMTGMEESRITYDYVDGSIVDDRRNQTYLPSDTRQQDLTKLENADWKGLLGAVRKTPPGERDYTALNVTLTGQTSPTEFIVMFENWDTVADWTLLVFASKAEVDKAIHVFTATNISSDHEPTNAEVNNLAMEGAHGEVLDGTSMIVNGGNLDVTLALASTPNWIDIHDAALFQGDNKYTLRAGESVPIRFQVVTKDLAIGRQSYSIVFEVQDDHYPDCFYNAPISIPFSVIINPKNCGDQRVANADGNCICDYGSVEVNGNCMKTGGLAVAIVLPIFVLAALAVFLYIRQKRRHDDAVWEIDPSELESENPPKIIGEGSFGQVILAQYRGTSVAVKSLRPVGSKGPFSAFIMPVSGTEFDAMEKGHLGKGTTMRTIRNSAEHDFVKEIRLLSKLQHRNIVCVMGAVMKERAVPQLVLEYMENGSLHDFLRRDTSLDGAVILGILKDITQGLRFLHNATPHYVLHKDLKSKNILIDDHNRAKVSDFGGTATGTPYWLSPELLMGKEHSKASDIYAMGVTLYEIYAQSMPYEGEDPVLVLQQVKDPQVNKRPPFPPKMKSCIAAMMHDCLVANPEERPTMDELAVRIDRFKKVDVEYQVLTDVQDTGLGFLNKLFPAHVAKAISEGRVIEPDSFELATVVHCEIVGFAALSSELPPIKIADLMHRLFDRFDVLADGYDIFKVDLSGGGAWMGATNCIKDQLKDHAKRIAGFARDAVEAAGEVLIDELHPESGCIQVQVAFVSGPMQGKVVGSRPPRYSLYGPIVDSVSFLAGQKSEAGGILINECAQELLEKQAPEILTKITGRVFVPGCGAVTTFWVSPKAPSEQAPEVPEKQTK